MSAPAASVRLSAWMPADGAARVWRARGQLHVTVVVKASFSLIHGEDMQPLEPEPVLHGDLYDREGPTRSAKATSELSPYLQQADVTLTGYARAPEGTKVASMPVRLAIHRGHLLLDKTLHVHGERRSDGRREPFERMPLVYERAVGGPGWGANPFGVGAKDGAVVDAALASIVSPSDPALTAGFGPIPRAFPDRRRLLGNLDPRALDQPIAEIPDALDWGYFQSAPRDQRIEYLHGDEWIVLEGMNPVLPRIESRLPDARAVACVYGLPGTAPGVARAVALHADTLRIDAEDLRCSLVWRGLVPVRDEAALADLHFVVAVDLRDIPIEWPPSAEPALAAAPAPEATSPAPEAPARHEGTLVAEDSPASRAPALPFRPGPSALERSPWAAAARSATEAAPPEQSSPASSVSDESTQVLDEGTHVLDDDELTAAAQRAATPFRTTTAIAAGSPAPPVAAFAAPSAAPVETSPWARHVPSFEPAPSRPAEPSPVSEKPSAPAPVKPAAAAPPPALLLPELGPRSEDAIPVVTRTPLVAFTLPWQTRPGHEARSVVVKGTFDLIPGGPATPCDETDAPSGDVHLGDDLGRSVLYPSDFVPLKPKVDVTLAGHAYAPGGSATRSLVGFRFGRRAGAQGFERVIAVFGPRHWQSSLLDTTPSKPERFDAVPLVYERAFGGAGFDRNPVGLGFGDGARLPQLEDPNHVVRARGDTPEPVGFGAVPMVWPLRWSKLGTYDAAWQKTRFPHFPADFDFAFFQAAPSAQQLDHVEGDEPFELTGMHPDHPKLEGTLPGIRPRCFARRASAAGGALDEIVLRLDTVSFDVDELKVNLVWRGLVEVSDDEASEIVELFVMAEPLAGPRTSQAQVEAQYLAARARLSPVEEDPDAMVPANETTPGHGASDELAPHERRLRDKLRAAGVLEETTIDAKSPPPIPIDEAAGERDGSAPDLSPEIARLPPELDAVRRDVEARLARREALAGADLSGADLSELDFSGCSLADANLQGSLLRRCRFVGADLSGAQLSDADLTGAQLTDANLEGADLSGAIVEAASFERALVDDADFGGARGPRASFAGARGHGARFVEGEWTEARFDGAELDAGDFTRATIDHAVFDGATLPAIRLYEANATRASFAGATLTGARADGVLLAMGSLKGVSASSSVWDKATLDDVTFTGAVLAGASFAKASAARAVFTGAELTDARLPRAKLQAASFLRANLMMASLEGADLSSADLRGANLHGAETWRAKLEGARLELAITTNTKLKAAAR